MMNWIRKVLSFLVLSWDRLVPVRQLVERTPARQAHVNDETSNLAIYQFISCPFCVKVRRQVRMLGLQIEYKDVLASQQAHDELMTGGKEYQVPCLRIARQDGTFEWLYESDAINAWLAERYST